MKKSAKVFAAVAGAALVVAGGSAYTAANTVPASVAGFAQNDVTGAEVNNIEHTLTGTGATLDSTELTFVESQQDNTVTGTVFDAADAVLETVDCTVGATPYTSAVCDWTAVDTEDVDSMSVAVKQQVTH